MTQELKYYWLLNNRIHFMDDETHRTREFNTIITTKNDYMNAQNLMNAQRQAMSRMNLEIAKAGGTLLNEDNLMDVIVTGVFCLGRMIQTEFEGENQTSPNQLLLDGVTSSNEVHE